MEFQGRIAKILPKLSGVNKNGNAWSKTEFIFEYFEHETDRFSDKVLLGDMAGRVESLNLQEGEEVIVGFGHNVHESNGKYYNNINPYKIERVNGVNGANGNAVTGASGQQQPQQAPSAAAQTAQASQGQEGEKKDDLPF